jgi:hypothetical protein
MSQQIPQQGQIFTDAKGYITRPWYVFLSLLTGGGASGTVSPGQLVVGGPTPGTIAGGNLSGDVSTSGSTVTTLATVNASPGTYGDATHVAQVTVNGKGLVTTATNVLITGGAGTPGLDGIDGLQGPTGPTGATGATGAQGNPGIDGLDGSTGAAGATGATGATGAQGLDGLDGMMGATGPAGSAGAAGSNGIDGLDGNVLNPTGITAGTYGSSTTVGQFTVNPYGILTAATPVTITASGIGGATPSFAYFAGVSLS